MYFLSMSSKREIMGRDSHSDLHSPERRLNQSPTHLPSRNNRPGDLPVFDSSISITRAQLLALLGRHVSLAELRGRQRSTGPGRPFGNTSIRGPSRRRRLVDVDPPSPTTNLSGYISRNRSEKQIIIGKIDAQLPAHGIAQSPSEAWTALERSEFAQ